MKDLKTTRRLALISQSGSCMKSVLAQAVALQAQKNGLSVTVVDLDQEHVTSLDWIEERKKVKLDQLFRVIGAASAQEAVKSIQDEDLFVFDCPSRATSATRTVAKSADLVLQPVLSGSKKDADLALEIFHQLAQPKNGEPGIPVDRMAMILTRYTTPSEVEETRGYLEEGLINGQSIRVLQAAIPDKRGYRKAVAEGLTITETSFLQLNQLALGAVFEIGAILNELTQ